MLSSAIAGLAGRFNGQVFLELPDELAPDFLGEIVSTANAIISADPCFAWLLVDRRTELDRFKPVCGFRELAQLREDRRLVVCFASDNRGMSTYTTVYAPLFGPEFPSVGGSEAITGGIAGLSDLAEELAARIGDAIGGGPFHEEVVDATGSILGLLAESYRQEGNTASSWVSRWWLHTARWADEVVEAVEGVRRKKLDVELLKLMFGVAGLPSPDSGPKYGPRMRREYAKAIRERWSSVAAVQDEIARLARRPEAADGAKSLQRIAWEAEFVGARDGVGSLIEAITSAGQRTTSFERRIGWASISESAFLSRRISSTELALFRDGQPLTTPWPGVNVLRVRADEVSSDRPAVMELRNLTVVIPFLDLIVPPEESPDITRLRNDLVPRASPGEVVSCEMAHPRVTEAGLEIDMSVKLHLPSWTAKAVRFAIAVGGESALFLGDEVSTRVIVLAPDAALLLYRRSGMRSRDPKTHAAQYFPGGHLGREPEDIQLDHGGLYSVALALGARALDYAANACIEPRRGNSTFQALDGVPWLLQSEPRPLESGDSITCDVGPLFSFQVKDLGERPLSPLIAACMGTRPSVESRSDLLGQCFGKLEKLIMSALRHIESDVSNSTLGHILLTTSEIRHEVELSADGYFASRALLGSVPNKYPPFPSADLKMLPQYGSLVRAYRDLGISAWIDRAEQLENSHGLLLSRVSLRDIDQEKIDALLARYVELVAAADALQNSTDGFWARFPMSIFAFPDSRAESNCEAVFLSPAHPLRIAWLWQLEKAFAVVREETGEPPAYARLSEGWTFPWVSGIRPLFGSEPIPIVSVLCDPGPDHVFVGWSALVRLSSTEAHELRAPQMVNGFRFPIGASSGLTDSAVEGAMQDFVRVFPQVRTLVVELPAFQNVQRSGSVDSALGAAFQRLTSGEDSPWCLPGGLRVRDSVLRLGSVPARDEIVRRNLGAGGHRKIEWERHDPRSHTVGKEGPVHIRLVESQTCQLAAASQGTGRAGFPRVALRRFPRRSRHEHGIVIDPSFQSQACSSHFASAIEACESVPGKPPFALLIIPGASFADLESADWTITGDAGLDPAVLQRIAVGTSSRHMLWEWRPAVAAGAELQLEQRPFVTISRVPDAFSTSLREKVGLLLPPEEQPQLHARVDDVIGMLAQRGIGLNSLLAMGHHHATGALGFYFAFCLLNQWASSRGLKETRLIVPVDAIDAFLRSVSKKTTKPIDATRLADLLLISCVELEGKSVIRLVPIEIKHYGLRDDEGAGGFPGAGEARLDSHIEQLADYSALLKNIQSLREEASEIHGCLIDTAIGAVIDAATLLDPDLQGGDNPVVLRNLASGSIELQICSGVLLWFQKGGATSEDSDAIWCRSEDSPSLHAKVFVDPLACWKEVWLKESGEACRVVAEALGWCLKAEDSVGGSLRADKAIVVDTGVEAQRRTSPPDPDLDTSGYKDSDVGRAITPTPVPNIAPLRKPDPDQPSGAFINVDSAAMPGPPPSATVLGQHPEATPDVVGRPRGGARRRGLPTEDLERRYRAILKTFQEFRVQVHPPETPSDRFTEGPASIVFGIRPGFGVPVGRIESQVENLKLRLNLDSKAKIDFKVHRGLVLLDVPKADSERYFVDAKDMWARWKRPEMGFSVPIGEDRYGKIVPIDWADSNSPHLLLAGQTGSGKSVALLAILMGAVHYYSTDELRLVLVDPKRIELSRFQGSPYLHEGKLLYDAPEAVEALKRAVNEMEERYKAFADAGIGITNLDAFNRGAAIGRRKPRWLIVLDEYADLVHDAVAKTEIENSLKRLAQKARAAGIHVLVSTQKPIVEVISTVVRGNLPAQLALRVKSGSESHVILDEGGADKLTGKGDALLKVGGNVTRLQCAMYKIE